MITPSILAWSARKASFNHPELPAVSFCPRKNAASRFASMSFASSASPLSERAEARPSSALKPVFELAGLVMPKVRRPAAAASAMSFQVTWATLPEASVQPSARAFEAFSPSTTGVVMVRSVVTIRLRTSGTSCA